MRRYENVNISKLKPYENNARTHSPEQIDKIVRSIEEFGFINPVLIDGDFGIIAGHGRVMAATKMGMKEVPCLFVEDLTEAQKKAYIIADNKLTEEGGWDETILKIELGELEAMDFDVSLTGFDLADFKLDDISTEVVEDDFEAEPPTEPKAKFGQIYQLGRHRLMCGDSTDRAMIERLIDGAKVDMVFTDPPYGIEVVQNNQVGGSGATHFKGRIGEVIQSSNYREIKGDETTDTARLNYEIIKDISTNQIIFGGNYFTDFLPPKACWCIWDKENTGNFADVEMAWTSFDKGAKLYKWLWNGLCRKGERSVEGKSRVHPTQKPVGLIAEILKDFSEENNIILDCFGGSGSTMIACEQIKRECLMIEYEPYYVDVIINRWEQFTGQKAVLLSE